MSIRTERVASLVKEEIGNILIREYNDPAHGFITVTEVRVTPDLRIARIYFSIFGAEGIHTRTMAMLEAEKSHIRGLVASRLTLRFVPALEFYRDDTMDRVERINTLIRKIHDDEGSSGNASSS
jgi:ribosome-binding factor A